MIEQSHSDLQIKFLRECQVAINEFHTSEKSNSEFLHGTSDLATTLIAANCQMLNEEGVGKYLDEVMGIIHKKLKILSVMFEEMEK